VSSQRRLRREAQRTLQHQNRADRKGIIAAAYNSPIVHLGVIDGIETWRRGETLFGSHAIDETTSPEVKACVAVRRQALMTGRCECGAVAGADRQGRLNWSHATDCPGSDQALRRAFAESEKQA
jgi:hypothetical protein